ncbi:MAG TPA: RHS repeat-associated core domain-containing protein [Spirochaetota bacterium]|nr:RHS repeat-associated core domain-containing protein [Spirochaetota bacterium]
MRNKTVVSKHIFAGNQRVASTVSMKDNCGTVSEKNTMYFHPDHLGSSSYVTDKKGNFFEMIEYLPYGETLYDEAATADKTEFRFTGHLKDDETGFYYCHARYYDPKLCKWISADPILEEYFPTGDKEKDKQLSGMGGAFNSVNLNLYHYAGNSPIVMIDPDGKATKHSGMVKSVNKTYNANVAKGQFSGDKAGAVSWMIDFFIFNVSHPNRTSNERYTRVADVTIDVISNVLESKQNGHMDVADFGIFLGMVMEEDYSTGKLMIHTQIQSESPGAEPWYYVEKSQTMGEFLQGKGKVNKTAVLYIEDIYNSYKNGVDAVDKLYERNKDRMSEESYLKLREAAKSNTLHEKGKGK